MTRPTQTGGGMLAILVLLATPAHATLLPNLSDTEIAERSDAIVVGEVLAQETIREPVRRRVVTRVVVGVSEYLKGAGPEEILVETPGGEIDDIDVRVLGAPRFELGEGVVLFLRAGPDAARVVAMTLGKLRMSGPAGSPQLTRDLGSVALIQSGPTGRADEAAPRCARSISLADLRRIVASPRAQVAPGRTLRPLVRAPYVQ